MQIIVTHDGADFDALSSAVAAQKLYPDATIVLGRRLGPEVRDFLALHKDRFPCLRCPASNLDEVTRMIIVDVRRESRLRDFAPVLERARAGEVSIHIYDHHAPADDDLSGDVEAVEEVGCATTLLVERLAKQDVAIDAMEATLFALGIHADTGSLTHPGTTARDAAALAWVLGRGASLDMVRRYLRAPFNPAQRQVLDRLLAAATPEDVGEVTVAVSEIPLDASVDGLAEVVREAADVIGHRAFFALFRMPKGRVQVIARGSSPLVDVGAALTVIGGGGHPSAASAAIKDAPADLREQILDALRERPAAPTRVAELMSTPVHTVAHDATLEEIEQVLNEHRFTGVVVTREGAMAGVISRRDLARAKERGHLHLPAAGSMSQHVITTTEQTSLDEALRLMERADIGRLPVLRDGELVGILTRTDVLRALYGSNDAR